MYETSPVVQWLRLDVSTAGGKGLIPGGGTKIPNVACHGIKKKKKSKCLDNIFESFYDIDRGNSVPVKGWDQFKLRQ